MPMRGNMKTFALGFPWFGGVRVRVSEEAVVIGAVVLTLGTARVALAGINVWTSHGPYGGRISALAIDPVTPTILYAATGGGLLPEGGVFRSTDSGASWSAVNTGLSGNALS